MQLSRNVDTLIVESSVFVLAEQRLSYTGQCLGFQQLQSLFESVVDVDLQGVVEDADASRSVDRY